MDATSVIKNPEKECQAVPELSQESAITGIETADCRRGIILDSPEEFAEALAAYSCGSVKGSRAAEKELLDDIGRQQGAMGVGLALLFGAKNADGFTEMLIEEALSGLQSTGRYNRHIDYDGMGTVFFKTTVEGEKVGDKYVLELSAAYVGSAPESQLAEALGKPLALVNSRAKAVLSIVDGWWFNINLENILADLPVSRRQARKLTEYIASKGVSRNKPDFDFKHESQNFSLDIRLNADSYLRPENGECGSEYMQARGENIVGGAWANWSEDGNHRIDVPRLARPSVELYVSLYGDRYLKPAAVTESQIKAVQAARDYVAGFIRVNAASCL